MKPPVLSERRNENVKDQITHTYLSGSLGSHIITLCACTMGKVIGLSVGT